MGLFFKTKKDTFQKFWTWFKENENRLYNFERDQEKIFDELSRELSLVDTNLTFEFSYIKDNGKREFVISAGGIKSSFPSVEGLVERAPFFEKWTIIKYRPRRKTLNELKFEEKCVKPDDVYYAIFNDKDTSKVGILLFFKDYKESEKDVWGQIGYLFLDEALGEYDVETKVGAIIFESTGSEYFKHSHRLSELQKDFDSYFS
jgi:hypothetical protein